MRYPYTVLKRRTSEFAKPTYYVRFWSRELGTYTRTKSVLSMVEFLELDPDAYPPSQKASARLIAEEWIHRGLHTTHKIQQVYAKEYFSTFWDWEKSEFIRGKLSRNPQSIGKQYTQNNHSYMLRFIVPKLPNVVMSEITTQMIEKLLLDLQKTSELGGGEPLTIYFKQYAFRLRKHSGSVS